MFAHIRPIFIAFLSLCLGIWFAELFRQGKIIYIILLSAILVLIIALTFFRLKFKKSKFFHYLWRVRKGTITMFVAVIVGFSSFTLAYNRIIQEEVMDVDSTVDYIVMGTVRSAPIEYEAYMTMFVDDAMLTDNDYNLDLGDQGIYLKIDTENIDDSSVLYTAEAGDTIILVATLKNVDVFNEDDIFSYAYKNNFRYMAYADQDNISVISGKMSGLDSVRKYVKDTLYANMDERYAGLAYAVFIGDKSGLDYDLQSNFQATGIAHLLAISGLHVGFMVLLLMFLLKLCRLKSLWRTCIISILLVLYCILCGFSPSVVRASLMAVFLLLGQSLGKQGDNLNSLSLAGILLLLIDPMYLFDLSFLLSFASVFSIIMLYPMFEEWFMKLHLGKFVSATLAISLSAQIGTLPLLINTFGYVSVIALLVNFLLVPLFGYVYMALFSSLIITMIFSFMGFLLWVFQWGLWLIDIISSWFASFSFATVFVQGLVPIVLVIFFVALFCLSRFCVIKKRKNKAIVLSVAGFILISSVVLNYTVFPLL